MIKRFTYIALLLLFAQYLSFADTIKHNNRVITFSHSNTFTVPTSIDTAKKTKQQQEAEKKKEDDKNNKIKEIAKAKRQAKPEKVDDKAAPKAKPTTRDRRPEGMERPPEIPRRNGN